MFYTRDLPYLTPIQQFITLLKISSRLKVDDSGCWHWNGKPSQNYALLGIRKQTYNVNRIVHEILIGPISPGMFICHSCDTPSCCNPSHLWLGTHQDNMADMVNKRRFGGGLYTIDQITDKERRLIKFAKLRSFKRGCYVWHGRKLIKFAPKQWTTPDRFAWVAWYKSIPQHMEIGHTCGNKHCVNPNHLCLKPAGAEPNAHFSYSLKQH